MPDGHSAHQAFESSVAPARLADDLRYTRYRATELHGEPMNAGVAPGVTLARIGAATVTSAGVVCELVSA